MQNFGLEQSIIGRQLLTGEATLTYFIKGPQNNKPMLCSKHNWNQKWSLGLRAPPGFKAVFPLLPLKYLGERKPNKQKNRDEVIPHGSGKIAVVLGVWAHYLVLHFSYAPPQIIPLVWMLPLFLPMHGLLKAIIIRAGKDLPFIFHHFFLC